jgi:glutamine synthetase
MEQRDTNYVVNQAKDHNVKFIRLWFTDILGFLKSVAIVVDELEDALNDGIGFDGSSIEGFARADESDMLAVPIPTTFQILPWRPQTEHAVARMFCTICYPDGRPYEGDPRYVLQSALKRAYEMGYTFYVGPELEYFYFKHDEPPPIGLDKGGYFDLTPLDVASDLRRDTVMTLEQVGIDVEYSHHEGAPSQHEIDLRYADALSMADSIMTTRLVVKEIAAKHGIYASFMPKPMSDCNGSGMHTHMSLFRGETNVFYNPETPDKLSQTGEQFVAGLLRHAAEFTLITNQWVNSYKRLTPGFEAPTQIAWAYRNRAHILRVPAIKPGRSESMRIELRSPDVACNPYLAFAVLLSAGLEGIEKQYEPVPAVEGSPEQMSEKERKRKGIRRLPGDLGEATRLAAQSELLRRALGDQVSQKLIENKRIEWRKFMAHVTDYELDRYLPML